MRRIINSVFFGIVVSVVMAVAVFFWFLKQDAIIVYDRSSEISPEPIISDSVVEAMLSLRPSNEWSDIEADLAISDFRGFADDLAELEQLFNTNER